MQTPVETDLSYASNTPSDTPEGLRDDGGLYRQNNKNGIIATEENKTDGNGDDRPPADAPSGGGLGAAETGRDESNPTSPTSLGGLSGGEIIKNSVISSSVTIDHYENNIDHHAGQSPLQRSGESVPDIDSESEPEDDFSDTCLETFDSPSSGDSETSPVRRRESSRRRMKGSGSLQQGASGIWMLRCSINGKRVAKSTGTKDRAEAERFVRQFLAPYVKDNAEETFRRIKAAVASEKMLSEMREEDAPQLKLDDAWQVYRDSPFRRDLSRTTLEGKENVFSQFVRYMHDNFPAATEVRHVSRFHVEKYLIQMREDFTASTYNNRLCVLREVFRNLMETAKMKENPWDGFPLRANDSHVRRELTVEELGRLIDVARVEGPEWRTLFAIGMYTGLRLGDCCKLTWAETDIVRSLIQKIPEKTKKYRKGRPVTIPIHKTLSDLLVQTPVERRQGFVLPTIGAWAASGRNGMGKVHHKIGKIFKNAGIVTSVSIEGRRHKAPEASFHSLRHTFVSMSANAGVPLHIVASIVGHESSAMTRHYFHENAAALAQAVESIPSISGSKDIRPGEVARPDASRMYPRGYVAPHVEAAIENGRRPYLLSGASVSPLGEPARLPAPAVPADRMDCITVETFSPAAQGAQDALSAPPAAAAPTPQGETLDATEAPQDAQTGSVGPAPARVVGEDGVERENPHAEAPLVGRSAERNAVRREEKLAVVEQANRDAEKLGGWGQPQASPQAPAVSSDEVGRWVASCLRYWAASRKTSLKEGTLQLICNGGFKFLEDLKRSGANIAPEDAIRAMETFLKAKNGR